MRLDVLKRDAQQHMIDPLQHHGWTVTIEQATPGPDLMILNASKAGITRTFALIYSAATDNTVYANLAKCVGQIYFRGGPDRLDYFARGIEPQPKPLSAFPADIVAWNKATSPGKFSPVGDEAVHAKAQRPDYIRLLSEEPIDAIWLRLRQLQSRTLAEKLVKARADREGAGLSPEVVSAKAIGIAFALRNASDYFSVADKKNISQRVLNLYYGVMALASAEMLAAPRGASSLAEIEQSTVQGHGLRTVPGADESLETISVVPIGQGFFADWLRVAGVEMLVYPAKPPKKYEELAEIDANFKITLEELFSSIPELGDLLMAIFSIAPRFAQIHIDQVSNMGLLGPAGKNVDRVYVELIDASATMTKEDVAGFWGPLSEIEPVSSKYAGRVFRAAVEHGGRNPWAAMNTHTSPFTKPTVIKPVFGVIREFRMICLILLYALSIVVRYRPSLWRRVQEGDLDQFRALIEAFLEVAERVLPEEFLETITSQKVHANQPGSLYG